ncbi:ABC transporter ATP-binding protein [Sulfurimonas sediminis]|uniref:ABC transporter ATP-binding protein n=1 Tax=Sulfurimonas sediminis TaxID=2590020 RepID=A0A7M1B3T7_9BACT|nr:ABC transporter ATP-binding protein [Sulfurimonas sediminis]QOP43368.1 ABC transporter ATP-binding protein [Sulfurimonas sediminis]
MITLQNIEFSYEEKKVLHDISLTINKGEKVVLLGSNGSGKSTLLRILAALYFPKKGEYLFHTKKVSKKNIDKNFRKKVGILFQNPESMIFNPTVKDEIAFSLREFDEENIDKKVLAISEKFGIAHLLDKNPLELSGGEKQKVVLASILIYEPEILLLDEPTAAMDPRTTGWFVDLMLEIETTVIVATHDLSIAYEVSNRAIVLDEKHTMVYDGDIEKLFKDLQTLQKANLIHKHKHRHKKDFTHSHYHLHF